MSLVPEPPTMGETMAKVNESLVAEMVKAGKMPPAVLDHIGHKRHKITSPSCEFCARSADTLSE